MNWTAGTSTYDTGETRDPMSRAYRKGRATVPMNDLCRRALEIARAVRLTDHVIEYGGRPVASVKTGFRAAVQRAGLPKGISPHTIRHTVATITRRGDQEVAKIGQLLGHAPGSKVTAGVYIHDDPAALRPTVDLLTIPAPRKPAAE